MKKSNVEVRQNAALTDDKGNSMEFIGSKESRLRGLSRIIGAYCRQIRSSMVESQ